MTTSSIQYPLVFVINMKDSVERRAFMEKQLIALKLPFRFIGAVNGREMEPAEQQQSYNRRRHRLCFGKELEPAEIGCLLSHREIYRIIRDENISTAVILEDDVTLEPDFAEIIQKLAQSDIPWDIVRFIGSPKIYNRPRRKITALSDKYSLERIMSAHGGAYAYMVRQKAADVLLSKTAKSWLPIDMIHGRAWETGLNVLMLSPSPVRHDDGFPSTIGDARFDKASRRLQSWERLAYPWTRCAYKLGTLIGKNWIKMRTWPGDRLHNRSHMPATQPNDHA